MDHMPTVDGPITASRGKNAEARPNANVCARVLAIYLPVIMAIIQAAIMENKIEQITGTDIQINTDDIQWPGIINNEKNKLNSLRDFVKYVEKQIN
jgi:hypothetical protein